MVNEIQILFNKERNSIDSYEYLLKNFLDETEILEEALKY